MSRFLSPVTPIVLTVLFLVSGWVGGPANPVDYSIDQWLAAYRHAFPIVQQIAVTLTVFGSAYATFGLTIGGGICLLLRGERHRAGLLVFGFAAERLAMDGLKLLYARPRPEFDAHAVMTSSFSFPSGHASNSMTAFVLFALLVLPERWRFQGLAIAIICAVTVALTRPVLGVHWPTDIIGGWCLAGVAIWLVMLLEQRLSVEPA